MGSDEDRIAELNREASKLRDAVGSGETSVTTEQGSAEEINAIGERLFEQRLKALHAASEHIRKLDGHENLSLEERVRLETDLASYLSGDPRMSVGHAIGGFLAPLGSVLAARAAQDGPDQG